MPMELEDVMMRRCKINYKEARSLVVESREALGMSKFEPWTDDLRAETERRYESKFGALPETTPEMSDISAPGTMQTAASSSIDASEDPEPFHLYTLNKRGSKDQGDDATEEPTETEGGEESLSEPASPSNKKKKKKGLFSRFRKSARVNV